MSTAPAAVTHADFDRLSWHDDTIYGLRLDTADPDRGLWRSDLVLDIDHIVEWVCGIDKRPKFRVAPATLVFHDVTDLSLAIDWGDTGHRTALHEMAIDGIARAPVANQQICLDRAYYRWTIALNWPKGGAIAFGASGFTQTLRAAPVLLDEQQLPVADRIPL
jgi:hypothetical protein